jgi:hypothetical protein
LDRRGGTKAVGQEEEEAEMESSSSKRKDDIKRSLTRISLMNNKALSDNVYQLLELRKRGPSDLF